MMKRTRVEDVQYGTRPGPGGVGGSGGGGGGGGGTAGATTVSSGVVSIGSVVTGPHGGGAGLGVGIGGAIPTGSIGHHRIVPQHGGAQTIAYMPSTTPAGTNLKANNNNAIASENSVSGGAGGGNAALTQLSVGTVVTTGGGVPPSQAVQYSTSYVTSISSGGNLKTVSDNVSGVGAGSGPQTNSMRQRTISGGGTSNAAAANLTSAGQQISLQGPSQLSVVQTTTASGGAGAGGAGGLPASGQPVQMGGGAPPRLKVEDALSYLDQVKFQYADQPQIYNNFLDIMKEFKSHCIDTPGVIKRVSTLFQGHSDLIFGFNMFLPPGYKIEIHSNEMGCVVTMPSPPTGGPPGSSTTTVHSIGGGSAPNAAGENSSPLQHSQLASLKAQGANVTVGTASVVHPPIQSTGPVNLMTHGPPQTTIHALQSPATPGGGQPAHQQVGGTASATIGGQNVTVSSVGHIPQNYSRDRERTTITPAPASAAGGMILGTPNALNELGGAGGAPASGGHHNLHHISQANQYILMGEQTGQQNQPVEFNHAISYVNKIKNRYQNQPEKYKKFLEILHTYQKEQKFIKEGSLNQGKTLTEQEVYTQVAKLFGQDEDLLREFGQFLPDATNHQTTQFMSKSHSDHKRAGGGGTMAAAGVPLGPGSHITMSPAGSGPNAQGGSTGAGSQLQLSSGATISQISNSAHATVLGNLSAVNTSVSIKPFNNSQQNHVVNSSAGYSSGPRAELSFEKDYHHGLAGAAIHHTAGSHLPAGAHHGLGSAANIRSSFEKESHRSNHHSAAGANQKYMSQAGSLGGKSAKSPSYSSVPSPSLHSSLGPGSLERNSAAQLNNYQTPAMGNMHHHGVPQAGARRPASDDMGGNGLSSSALASGAPPAKRAKPICRDVSFAEASRKCTISDAAFFDKVRKALRSPEVYDNFLRCLTLFNQEIVSKTELLNLVSPFLSKFPDLLRWFTDFLGPPVSQVMGSGYGPSASGGHLEGIPLQASQRQGSSSSSNAAVNDRNNHQSGEFAQEIDLATCKRLGASYCALPASHMPKKCSGRTALCREVLNDKWVSFPTWASEDSTFVTSRKTQFEETIYRTEDERFELDVVIETNSATIRVLEGVQRKLSRMSPEELARYHLDDYLGGTSQTIHKRAIHRIYGDKSADIIQGMKNNPAVAVPVVLKRLKVKESEWRTAQKNFNKLWREQNEKYYLKSLDHQAINFKPNDMKSLRSKNLFNEIETLYDERHDQDDENGETVTGPHMVLPYEDKTILDDAANLLIHHVKRQTGIQKQEKTKIKHILRQFVPDLFFSTRQPLSDDEREDVFPFLIDDSDKMDVDPPTANSSTSNNASNNNSSQNKNNKNDDGSAATTAASSSSSSSSCNGQAASTAIKTEMPDGSAAAGGESEASAAEAKDAKLTGEGGSDSNANVLSGNAKKEANASGVTAGETTITLTDKNENKCDIKSSATSGTATTTAGGPNVDIKVEVNDEQDIKSEIPLPPHAISKHSEEAYTLFFANNSWYLFFRLHAILCDRLRTMYERAQILVAEEEKCRSKRSESTATALRLKPKCEVQVEDYYPTFLDMLKNVLDGNMDSNTFEDSMREMFGIHAYISFTLDKVVSNAVRQLQNCVTERSSLDCVELFHHEQRRNHAGGLCRNALKNYAGEMSYKRKAEADINDENLFRIYIYKIDCRVTIELLDTDQEETVKSANILKGWNKYVDRMSNPATAGSSNVADASAGGSSGSADGVLSEIKLEQNNDDPNGTLLDSHQSRKARFLKRNKRVACIKAEQARLQHEKSLTAAATTASSHPGDSANADNGANDGPTATSNATGSNATNASLDEADGGRAKRPPERVGNALVGTGSEKYLISDRDEIKLNSSGRQVFVINKNLKFFKLESVRRAKLSHKSVTQNKFKRFQRFAKQWLSDNVSEAQQQTCNDWLLNKGSGDSPKSPKTKLLLQNDTKRTPYRCYNRYKVMRPESFGGSGNNSSNNGRSQQETPSGLTTGLGGGLQGNSVASTNTAAGGASSSGLSSATSAAGAASSAASGTPASNNPPGQGDGPQVKPVES